MIADLQVLNGYFNFSTPLRPLKTNVQISWNATYHRIVLLVNATPNNADRWINRVDVSLDNRKKESIAEPWLLSTS